MENLGLGKIHPKAVACRDRSERHFRYQLTLVPPLALLALRRDVRIFQTLSVPDIVEQLLSEAGLSADTRQWRINRTYPARDYCVQYNETTLAFIERILAEEGIHYHFLHAAEHAQLILADGPEGLDTLAPLPFKTEAGLATESHAIHALSVGPAVRTGSVSLRDVDFTRPALLLRPNSLSQPAAGAADEQRLEDYRWPGPFTTQARGSQLTELSLARQRHNREQVTGASNSPQLMVGHYQPLSEHPESAYNQSWLLTELHYQGTQPQVLGELADSQQHEYRNTFTAQAWTNPYLPPGQPKPLVPGQQSAIVTGPAGEEIYCDEYGRVKVQFYWDRLGQGDEKSSTWLRVSQGWAGNGYGQFVLPRVGMEVLVSFINGDPDRPIITGCLFNGNNAVPYALPEHKTRSTFKTASSPGAKSSNELRFEDKAGSEHIYQHAAKDYQERISNNSHSHIVNDRQQLIEGQHISEVRGEQHHTVHGNSHWHAQGDAHQVSDANRHTKIGSKDLLEAGDELHIKAGQKVVIEANLEITLTAGGAMFKIDPSGIKAMGAAVNINAGGLAARGSGLGILLPLVPIPAPRNLVSKPLLKAQANPPIAREEVEEIKYGFKMQLLDIPGDDGFPLGYTPWQLVQGECEVLFAGETDGEGYVMLDDEQQLQLSNEYLNSGGDIWLCFPGQRVQLSVHLEQEGWDAHRIALAAFDYSCQVNPALCQSPMLEQRSKQDSQCSGDIYTYLQSKS